MFLKLILHTATINRFRSEQALFTFSHGTHIVCFGAIHKVYPIEKWTGGTILVKAITRTSPIGDQ